MSLIGLPVIGSIKKTSPETKLFGFKLLDGVSHEELIEVATRLREKNQADYIIANDLHDLRQGQHLSFLVNEDGYQNVEFHSPTDIYDTARSLVLKK